MYGSDAAGKDVKNVMSIELKYDALAKKTAINSSFYFLQIIH